MWFRVIEKAEKNKPPQSQRVFDLAAQHARHISISRLASDGGRPPLQPSPLPPSRLHPTIPTSTHPADQKNHKLRRKPGRPSPPWPQRQTPGQQGAAWNPPTDTTLPPPAALPPSSRWPTAQTIAVKTLAAVAKQHTQPSRLSASGFAVWWWRRLERKKEEKTHSWVTRAF